MEITIKGTPKEIADLAAQLQGRPLGKYSPTSIMVEALAQAIDDIAAKEQES